MDPYWEWDITTSGEEWFSAERNNNTLVVTISESSDKLERKGTISVKVGTGEDVAEASLVVWQVGTNTEELIYEVETTEPNQRVVAAPILTLQNGGKMTADFGEKPIPIQGPHAHSRILAPAAIRSARAPHSASIV